MLCSSWLCAISDAIGGSTNRQSSRESGISIFLMWMSLPNLCRFTRDDNGCPLQVCNYACFGFNIQLVCFPPHPTHDCQLLDSDCVHILKDQQCDKYEWEKNRAAWTLHHCRIIVMGQISSYPYNSSGFFPIAGNKE